MPDWRNRSAFCRRSRSRSLRSDMGGSARSVHENAHAIPAGCGARSHAAGWIGWVLLDLDDAEANDAGRGAYVDLVGDLAVQQSLAEGRLVRNQTLARG